MKSLIAGLLAFSLVGCAPVSIKQSDPDFAYMRQVTKLVKVGESGSCSGVVVAPVHVLTAAHCQNATLSVDGKPARIIKISTEADLMLLEVEVGWPGVKVADKQPDADSKIYTIGFPLSVGQVLTEGRVQVADHREIGPHDMLVSSPVVFGNSGGPVMDANMQLVGIVSKVAVVGFGSVVTHLAVVVNTETIKEFLKVGIRG